MGEEAYSEAALVLLGHGSTLNAESGAPVFQHAAELRRRRLFAEVYEAFWKQEPQVKEVLAKLTAWRVFVVPLFISEGYFSEGVIPRELGFRGEGGGEFSRVQQRGGQALVYCKPVGTHHSMTGVLLARAREVVERSPFPCVPRWKEVTLFIAGHGTEQNDRSREAIERQAELIRAMNLYAGVHAVFMEEEPRVGDCYGIAETKNIVVVPFFMSEGLHANEDIPMLLGEPEHTVRQRLQDAKPTWRNPTERQGKLVWYSASVGSEPRLAEVILERVREGAGWR